MITYVVQYDNFRFLAHSLSHALKIAQRGANSRLGGFDGVSIYAYELPCFRSRLVWRDGYPC